MDQVTVNQLIVILLPFICTAASVAAKHLFSLLPVSQQEQLISDENRARQFVTDAVHAIEQSQADMPGGNKKAQAEALIATLLKSAGINVAPEFVDTVIEAAVGAMNQGRVSDVTMKMPVVGK